MKARLLLLACFFFFAAHSQQNYFLLTGTYTVNTSSEGIYVYRYHAGTADLSPAGTARDSKNPSFLALSPDQQYVYAVNETGNGKGSGGFVTAYKLNHQSGQLGQINQQPSGGDDPCYVIVHPGGKWVVVGNYSSGTVSVLKVNADGSLQPPAVTVRHEGSGPNKKRQEKPHVHCTVFSADGKYLYVTDLGTDRVMIYSFNPESGLLTTAPFPSIRVKPGAGPRHFVFHPSGRFAYLIEEMGGSISVYSVKNAGLQFIQRISTLPAGFKGENYSADIHLAPGGKFLYASNRGSFNSMVVYSVNIETGRLSFVQRVSSGGDFPRNFSLDPSGKWLLAANQRSNSIVIFSRDPETGKLKDTGKRISVPSPVCLLWARSE